MSYQINHTEKTNPAKPPYTVQDQSLNRETSLSFPGKNYSGYAPVIAENFLHLLENFASNVQPVNPVQGQLWYDNSAGVNLLKVYDGTSWTAAGSVKKATAQQIEAASSANIKGDLWVDTENQQLYVFSGSNWLLIGPQFSAGLKTGPDVETITDTSNIDHNVVSIFSENQRIAIVSKTAFTPKTSLAGFTSIGQGVNLSTVDENNTTSPTKFWGTASKADALIVRGQTVVANNFLRSDDISTTNFPLNIRNNAGLSVGSDLSFNISTETNATILYSKISGNYVQIKTTSGSSIITSLHVDANGNIGLGPNNTNPQEVLDVAGNIVADGNLQILSTADATTLGVGSITTNGGLSVQRQSQFGGDIQVNGGIHFNNLDLNGNPVAGTVIVPGSDSASELYDLGSSTRRFRNIYAQNFVGNFNGAFTGSLSGNISGSSAKLASPTRFRIQGDVGTSEDVVFDGQLPQAGSPSGVQIFTTTVSSSIIDGKPRATDSFLTDQLLVYREGTGLRQVSKQTFISNIPIVPVGAMFPFAGETPPAGYLLCDGSELKIGDYSVLFSVIGYRYKAPALLLGSATFALPDLRGRFPLGADNMNNDLEVPDKINPLVPIPAGGGSANRVTDIVADTVGAGTNTGEFRSLAIENLPDHKHNLNSGFAQYYASGLPGAGDDPNADSGLGMPESSTGAGLRNSGGVISSTLGTPFNTMNPYLTINYIIFTGVI
jgi:microcystin-dependent protein